MANKKATTDEVVEEVKPSKTASDDTMKIMLETINSLKKEIETLKAEKQNINLSVTNKDMEVKRVISPEIKEEMERMNEKVLFQPMFDGVTYKDDIFVSINGKTYLINRREAYKNLFTFQDVYMTLLRNLKRTY